MTRRSRSRTSSLVAVALLAALTLIGATTQADTSTAVVQRMAGFEPDAPQPLVITYQGRLVDPTTGEPKPDGPYTALFELHAADAGGTPLWSEKQDIVVNNGLFSVTLGNETGNSIDPGLFDGYGRWLSVSIDPDGELTPRIRLAHAPYAIWANMAATAANADRLAGRPPSDYAAASHNHDAANITAGNLSTDRYHAVDDLSAEGFLGNAAGDIALNNGTKQATLNADMLDGQHNTDFATASHNHDAAYVNVTGDTMSGVLTVPRIAYTAPRTQYFVVGGEGFVPGSNVDYFNTYGNGGAYIVSGNGALVAPVHLPHGAVVTALKVFFYDTSASDMTVSLDLEGMSGGYYSMAEVTSAGISGYGNKSTTSIGGNPIDNTNASYCIYAFSSSWDGGNLRIKGALITYTISEAP